MKHIPGGPDRQAGLALAELAITLPFLLLLVFGVAELGRAFYQYTTLTKAVRDGARYLSSQVLGTTGNVTLSTEKVAATQNLVVFGSEQGIGAPILEGLTAGDVAVSADEVSDHVTVTAQYDYTPMFGGVIPTFGLAGGDISLSLTFTATTMMRFL